VPINWQLAQGNNALANFDKGMQLGDMWRKARDQAEVRKATAGFAANPDDPKTLNALIAASPDLGFKAAEYMREQAKARREQDFGDAFAEYAGGGARPLPPGTIPHPATTRGTPIIPAAPPSPGAGMSGQAPRSNGLNALTRAVSRQAAGPSPDQAPQLPDSFQEGAVFAAVGKPQSREDVAFLRMLRADPKRALEMESKMRDRFVDRLKDEHDAIGYGLSSLVGVADPATYAVRRMAIVHRLEPIIANIAEVLPEQFPGADGLRDIQMRVLDLKDQLSALLNRENVEEDNDRADRNTDSLINDREARRGIQRRGQDIRSADARRGQDVRASNTRDGRSGRGGSARVVSVRTPQEAMKLAPGTVFRTPDGRVKVR
jgi:hypothetical protein